MHMLMIARGWTDSRQTILGLGTLCNMSTQTASYMSVGKWKCMPTLVCRRQIELVQDLEFPAACHRIKATPDGQFLIATGTHAPRMRVYELSQLSMKFERHFDAEIVDFQVCAAEVLLFACC